MAQKNYNALCNMVSHRSALVNYYVPLYYDRIRIWTGCRIVFKIFQVSKYPAPERLDGVRAGLGEGCFLTPNAPIYSPSDMPVSCLSAWLCIAMMVMIMMIALIMMLTLMMTIMMNDNDDDAATIHQTMVNNYALEL